MNGRWTTPVIILIFTAAFFLLTMGSSSRFSPTWDEPGHLFSGYLTLRLGDYRFGGGAHPPLIRQWAALPMLFMKGIRVPTERLSFIRGNNSLFLSEFTDLDVDIERHIQSGRFMIVLLGILLGILLFLAAREIFDPPTAVGVLVLYTLEPNILAHSRLVTTDIGVALFYFATTYFLWRLARRLSIPNVLGFVFSFALAQSCKVSALILFPLAVGLLLYRSCREEPWRRSPAGSGDIVSRRGRLLAAALVFLLAVTTAYAFLWGTHRFQFALNRASGPQANEYDFPPQPPARQSSLRPLIGFVEDHRLLPRAYIRGVLSFLENGQEIRYVAGRIHRENVLYYFPLVFLLKTPLTHLILMAAAVVLLLIGRRSGCSPYLVIPPAVYALMAVFSGMNTGVRHLLPVFPFLILLAGHTLRRLLKNRRSMLLLVGLTALLGVEFWRIYPDYLASFNLLAGGPEHGYRWLVDSNLDWGQDLKNLKGWMERQGVSRINLCYYGVIDPAYYGIQAVHLPGSNMSPYKAPSLPGYLAISLTCLYGYPWDEYIRAFYQPLQSRTPTAMAGRSIRIYWVDRPWWNTACFPASPPVSGSEKGASPIP